MAKRRAPWRQILLAVMAVLLIGSYVTYTLFRPLPAIQPRITFHFSRTPSPASLAWPTYGESAIGAVGYGVLETHDAQTALPTASTIKILTALAVLQEKPLKPGETGPLITLTQDDVASYEHYVSIDGSVVRVTAGEQISEYQALQALLLPSANNIAETLARWAFGSLANFQAYATSYAQELGMANTTVTDPSGFLSTTTSTPHDLVLLGEAGLTSPVIAEIVQQSTATIPVEGVIHNVNVLLGQDGVVGIKTGNNDQNPGCFIVAAKHSVGAQDITVVGAIMNGPNLWTTMHDSVPLADSIAKSFVSVPVATVAAPVATYDIPWQQSVHAVTKSSINLATWSDTTITSDVVLPSLEPATSGDKTIGTLIVRDSIQAGQATALKLDHTISPPNIWWRLAHPL